MPMPRYMERTRSSYQHRWWRRNMRLGMKVSWLMNNSVNWAMMPWRQVKHRAIGTFTAETQILPQTFKDN